MEAYNLALPDPQKLTEIIKKHGLVYPKPIEGTLHPLQTAIRLGLTEPAKLLAACAENILFKGELKYDAIDEAAVFENYEMMEFMAKKLTAGQLSSWPLFIASKVNNLKMYKFCTEVLKMRFEDFYVFRCSTCDKKLSMTNFPHAVWHNSFEIVEYIIEKHPDIIQNTIVMPNSGRMLDLLISKGANVKTILVRFSQTCCAKSKNMSILFLRCPHFFFSNKLQYDICFALTVSEFASQLKNDLLQDNMMNDDDTSYDAPLISIVSRCLNGSLKYDADGWTCFEKDQIKKWILICGLGTTIFPNEIYLLLNSYTMVIDFFMTA